MFDFVEGEYYYNSDGDRMRCRYRDDEYAEFDGVVDGNVQCYWVMRFDWLKDNPARVPVPERGANPYYCYMSIVLGVIKL
jgi:hypothetical protein